MSALWLWLVSITKARADLANRLCAKPSGTSARTRSAKYPAGAALPSFGPMLHERLAASPVVREYRSTKSEAGANRFAEYEATMPCSSTWSAAS